MQEHAAEHLVINSIDGQVRPSSLHKGDVVKIINDIYPKNKYEVRKVRTSQDVVVLTLIGPTEYMCEEKSANVVKVDKTRKQVIAAWRKRHGESQ